MENEKRLISLDMACSMLNRFFCNAPTHAEKSAILEVKQALLEMATTEVVHGEWEKYTDDRFMGYGADGRIRYRKVYSYKCSKCWNYTAVKHNYCPNCGADMRERKDNE